jgi:uncharacterized NAD(P)/FAD-binding protein YdhS
MPPQNASRLLEMFDGGQLALLDAVTSVRPRPGGGFDISASRDMVADVVVAAITPSRHDPSPTARPLVDSLLAGGVAQPNAFGGIHADRLTNRVVDSTGLPNHRLHALGDITHGAFLFTFGVPSLALYAARIVEDIAMPSPADAAPAGGPTDTRRELDHASVDAASAVG